MLKTTSDISRDAYEALLERVSGLELAVSALAADNGQLAADNAELQAELGRVRASLDAQLAENARLLEQFKLLQMRHFGSRSERVDPDQLSLFNDVEAASDAEPEPEAEAEEPKRKRRRGGKRVVDLSKLEHVVVDHDLDEGDKLCPQCGSEMREIRTEVTHKLRMVPAHLVVEDHVTHVYVCESCSKANAAGGEDPAVLVRAPRPAEAFPGSLCTPSLAAWIIDQKYVGAEPLYRVEHRLAALGCEAGRADMSNWVLLAWERWLSRVRDRIRAYILGLQVIHADETPVQVLREPGREAQSKSYCWVFCSSAWDHPAYDYVYNESRAGRVACDHLSGWEGTLVTDGYRPYYRIEGVTNVACLAHVRRKFAELVKSAGGDAKAAASTGDLRLALDGRRLIDRIFAAEDAIGDGVSPEERAALRAGDVARAMGEFESWCHAMLPHSTPGLRLEAAIRYAIEYMPYVRNAVSEGRAELTNNRAERAVKPFVIGRKNWLFSNTSRGAEASCGIYSVVTTARECGLSPMRYVEWLLEELPLLDEPTDEAVDRLLPWSDQVPERLRVSQERTRALREAQEEPIVDVGPGALCEDE